VKELFVLRAFLKKLFIKAAFQKLLNISKKIGYSFFF